MLISDDLHATETSGSESESRANFLYCSYFCEENVYKMACKFTRCLGDGGTCLAPSLFVVFISSECKQTPIWHQKAGSSNKPVLWDYHVVVVAKDLSKSLLDFLLSSKEEIKAAFTVSDAFTVGNSETNTQLDLKNNLNQERRTESKKAKLDNLVHPSSEYSTGHIDSMASYIFDLDTNLPFPTSTEHYCSQSLRPDIMLSSRHEQRFRVISAKDFISNFSSDR